MSAASVEASRAICDFENEYKVCMALIKQKSKEISELIYFQKQ